MGSGPSSRLSLRAAEDGPEPRPGRRRTSSFMKVSRGERATGRAPRKKAGNTGASGTRFQALEPNLRTEQKTREGEGTPQIRPHQHPTAKAPVRRAQEWRRAALGQCPQCGHSPTWARGRAPVCSQVSERRGEARAALRGPAGSLCTSPGGPHSAPCWDLPLEEALFHLQAVDFEVFQLNFIQVDISN